MGQQISYAYQYILQKMCYIKGTVMQIEKALINDRLGVSKVP